MAKRILVGLNQGERAESVLPLVRDMARFSLTLQGRTPAERLAGVLPSPAASRRLTVGVPSC